MSLVTIAYAEDTETAARNFINSIFVSIVDPIIILLFALALMYLVWGLIKFINNVDNPSEREQGKRHIVYGIIGMFIMVSAFGIVRMIAGTIGTGNEVEQAIRR